MGFEKSETLKSRTYIGLLLSQFLAAFNDHASQIVAVFYASDMLVRFVGVEAVDEKLIVSIVTACFITPFFFFSPLAGVLADKYSKRSIIVFWKMAEIAIMGLALVGFVLPHTYESGYASMESLTAWSAWLLVATVFLMGTHSAFFVPAKYGVMPEILHASILSRGNGLLEGTSFVAQILGTAFGAFLYGQLKSQIVGSQITLGGEWIIGVVLFTLAVIGALGALLVRRMPAAAPDRQLVYNPLVPLISNFAVLKRSRPLILATAGIAFFTLMTLFLRQTLLFEGEAAKELQHAQQLLVAQGTPQPGLEIAEAEQLPQAATDLVPEASGAQQTEFRVAMLIALVGLGVGIGCSLAGYFSGHRLELGLVPIGAFLLAIFTATLAWFIHAGGWTLGCLVLIGISAGLYIVPLYTLLQHRAPKESKGSLVAMSNFLNVAGGLVAIAVFYFVTWALQSVFGMSITGHAVQRNTELLPQYVEQLEQQMHIPRILFLFASVLTAGMLYVLSRQRPDFVVRSLSWLASYGRRHLEADGVQNIPATGPLLMVGNSAKFNEVMDVVATTDRFLRFVIRERGVGTEPKLVQYFARRSKILLGVGADGHDPERTLAAARKTLTDGNLVGLGLGGDFEEGAEMLESLRPQATAGILPYYVGPLTTPDLKGRDKLIVRIGPPLAQDASLEEIQQAILELGAPTADPAPPDAVAL